MMPEKVENLDLFVYEDESIGTLELFPEIWQAMEQMISEDIDVRKQGVETIIETNAIQLSPVVAYYFATCLQEPDLDLRFRIVQALGMLLHPKKNDNVTPKPVRQAIKQYMLLQRRRGIWYLLEVAQKYIVAEPDVKALIGLNSFSGEILAEIMLDRKAPQDIRHQAIVFAGQVGFLETIPSIERLIDRLETKVAGQVTMAFMKNHPKPEDERELLPIARATLELLKKP